LTHKGLPTRGKPFDLPFGQYARRAIAQFMLNTTIFNGFLTQIRSAFWFGQLKGEENASKLAVQINTLRGVS
jgi:hypothetical protein